MTRDFSVDAEGMSQLLEKISAIEQMVWEHDVEDFLPSGEVGHSDVADSINEFSARWELGINAMAEDLSQIRGRVGGALEAYSEYNQLAEDAMIELRSIMDSLTQAPNLSSTPTLGLSSHGHMRG